MKFSVKKYAYYTSFRIKPAAENTKFSGIGWF